MSEWNGHGHVLWAPTPPYTIQVMLYLPVNFTVGKIDVTINCRPKLSLHGVVFLTSRRVEKARIHGIHHLLQRFTVSGKGGRGGEAKERTKIKLITETL